MTVDHRALHTFPPPFERFFSISLFDAIIDRSLRKKCFFHFLFRSKFFLSLALMFRFNLLFADNSRVRIRRAPLFDLRRCTYQQPVTRSFIEQLGKQNYIRINDIPCPFCQHPMKLQRRKRRLDGYQLRCRSCDTMESIRCNSFFARHDKIPLPTIIHIIRSLYEGRQQRYIASETQLNPLTIQRIHTDYIELCRRANDARPIIFPSDEIVEIDEKHLKWKLGLYDPDPNAMVVEGHWVLGLFGRKSGKVYMVPVIGRSEDDLIPIITNRVQQGATIITDKLST